MGTYFSIYCWTCCFTLVEISSPQPRSQVSLHFTEEQRQPQNTIEVSQAGESHPLAKRESKEKLGNIVTKICKPPISGLLLFLGSCKY